MNKIDPVSTEIIRNTFISIAEDMNAALIRSAYTPVIYEGKDCVVALLDEHETQWLAKMFGAGPYAKKIEWYRIDTVSYTHLTLPTKA